MIEIPKTIASKIKTAIAMRIKSILLMTQHKKSVNSLSFLNIFVNFSTLILRV
jgi:hypothetical protein